MGHVVFLQQEGGREHGVPKECLQFWCLVDDMYFTERRESFKADNPEQVVASVGYKGCSGKLAKSVLQCGITGLPWSAVPNALSLL